MARQILNRNMGVVIPAMGETEHYSVLDFPGQMRRYFSSIAKQKIEPPTEMIECITAIAQAVYDSKNAHEPGISSEEMSMREALEEMREKKAATSSHALEEVASKYFEGKITDEQRALLRELSTDKSMREHAASLGWSLEHVHSVLEELKISRKK